MVVAGVINVDAGDVVHDIRGVVDVVGTARRRTTYYCLIVDIRQLMRSVIEEAAHSTVRIADLLQLAGGPVCEAGGATAAGLIAASGNSLDPTTRPVRERSVSAIPEVLPLAAGSAAATGDSSTFTGGSR